MEEIKDLRNKLLKIRKNMKLMQINNTEMRKILNDEINLSLKKCKSLNEEISNDSKKLHESLKKESRTEGKICQKHISHKTETGQISWLEVPILSMHKQKKCWTWIVIAVAKTG